MYMYVHSSCLEHLRKILELHVLFDWCSLLLGYTSMATCVPFVDVFDCINCVSLCVCEQLEESVVM